MKPNVWVRCSSGGCVEVRWVSACAQGGCVEVAHAEGRVLVRDSKLGDESPVIEFTPAGWRSFTLVADEWDHADRVMVSGVRLGRYPIGDEWRICLLDGEAGHLHFTPEEWDSFVEGVRAGKFSVPS